MPFYDALETRPPSEREAALFAALPSHIAQAQRMTANVTAMAKGEGLDYHFEKMPVVNTAPAKRQPATRPWSRAWELTSMAARLAPASTAWASWACSRSAKAVVCWAVTL